MNAENEFFRDADKIQHKPLTDAQWADANRVLFCWSDRTKWKCGLIIGETIKEADSRLIAAAPDMYAVLRELAECSQYWSDYDVPLGIHDRIVAALAKAGGQ